MNHRRDKLLPLVLILVLLASPLFLATRTVSSWTGRDWNALPQNYKEFFILGYITCAQALDEEYKGELTRVRQYRHLGETVQDIVRKIDFFYARKENLNYPLYRLITELNNFI